MLNIRKQSNETLTNMYNPKYMSENLIKVHKHIDQLVDKCYSKKKFKNDDERIKLLFQLYHINNEKLFKGTLITLRFRDNPINFYEALDDGYIHGTPYKYVENNI